MRKEYDFSEMKGKKNPCTRYLEQPVTIRLDKDTIAHFKVLAAKKGIPCQNLINLYLRDCAEKGRAENALGMVTGKPEHPGYRRALSRRPGPGAERSHEKRQTGDCMARWRRKQKERRRRRRGRHG